MQNSQGLKVNLPFVSWPDPTLAYTRYKQLLSSVWLRSGSLAAPLLGRHHRAGLEISVTPCLRQGDQFAIIAKAARPRPARNRWDLWRSCQLLRMSQPQSPSPETLWLPGSRPVAGQWFGDASCRDSHSGHHDTGLGAWFLCCPVDKR